MPAYLALDDLEDLVIHYHDIARLIEKQLGGDVGLEVRLLADKISKLVKEQKYGATDVR